MYDSDGIEFELEWKKEIRGPAQLVPGCQYMRTIQTWKEDDLLQPSEMGQSHLR
jgi:hypothetical protein